MNRLRTLSREEDALNKASVAKLNKPTVQAGRFAGLQSPQHVVRYAIHLTADRHTSVSHFKHSGMNVAYRVQPVTRRCFTRFEKLSTLQIGVQGEPAHQRAVDEQIDAHGVATSTEAGMATAVCGCSPGTRNARKPVMPAIST